MVNTLMASATEEFLRSWARDNSCKGFLQIPVSVGLKHLKGSEYIYKEHVWLAALACTQQAAGKWRLAHASFVKSSPGPFSPSD